MALPIAREVPSLAAAPSIGDFRVHRGGIAGRARDREVQVIGADAGDALAAVGDAADDGQQPQVDADVLAVPAV